MNVSGVSGAVPNLITRDMQAAILAAATAQRTEKAALANLPSAPPVPAVTAPGSGQDGSQVDLYL